jgi:hypothetical protein
MNRKRDKIMGVAKQTVSHAGLCLGKCSLVRLAVLAGLLAFTSCASVEPPPPVKGSSKATYQEGVPGGVFINTMVVSARVTAINNITRKVTLLDSEGKKFTVKAGPEAVNFDQIAVGDLVKLTLTEELVVFVSETGKSASDGSESMVKLAPKGSQPGGMIAETSQITGTVTAIDLKKHTATLRFQDGSTKTFPVRSDIDLSKHKTGEQVVLRVTEMMAIRVEKP